MKNVLVLWMMFLGFIAAIEKGALTEAEEQKIDDQYFNILSLDGAGMNGLVTAKLLSMIEQYAYNYTEDKKILQYAPVYENQKLIPIKDLFNMTAATSVTSFLAVGLSIPSSENATIPAYTAQNLVRLYKMKAQDLNRYYHYRPNQILLMIIIFLLAFFIFYWIGINKFNHTNIDKAYVIIGEYIKQFIKKAEKTQQDENSSQKDMEKAQGSESSDYEDKKNLDKKIKKRLKEEKNLEELNKQIMKYDEKRKDDAAYKNLENKQKECIQRIQKIKLKNYIYTKHQLVINNKNYDRFLFPNQGQSLDNELVKCLLEKKENLIVEKCLTLVYDSKNIKKYMGDEKEKDLVKLEEAQLLLLKSIHKYKSRKPMVWIVTFTGLFCIWYIINVLIPTLNGNYNFVIGDYGNSLSNNIGFSFSYLQKNSHLDTFMKDIYANGKFDDVLQDELLIESFEYESKKPRMFSKWFSKNAVNKSHYDFKLRDAIAASISCPDYYEPFSKDNTIFMDMMLAQAKNPAMNAYMMAKHLINNGQNKKIRMLSISANDQKQNKKNGTELFKEHRNHKYDYKIQPDSIITDKLMQQSLKKDYLRVSFHRPNVDDYGYLPPQQLEQSAENFYNEHKDNIESMIRQIIDERYNPKFKKKDTSADQKPKN